MKLIPKTKTARDKINTDSNQYILVEVRSDKDQIKLLVRSISNGAEHWIKQKNDENFDIVWD